MQTFLADLEKEAEALAAKASAFGQHELSQLADLVRRLVALAQGNTGAPAAPVAPEVPATSAAPAVVSCCEHDVQHTENGCTAPGCPCPGPVAS